MKARYYRKIIRIRAEDSPNVRVGMAYRDRGLPPPRPVLEGVLTYEEYEKRRATWDPAKQCVGLDAMFYTGVGLMLFPSEWLLHSAKRAQELRAQLLGRRIAETMGVDTAEGGDNTCFTVIDRLGIMEQISLKTPDTAVIPGMTIDLMRKHNLLPQKVGFDRGGGGKQIADRLRQIGYDVRTVSFGDAPSLEPHWGITLVPERMEVKEERSAYANLRAQMYGQASDLCDPAGGGYGIPAEMQELHRQLAAIPKIYDDKERLMLPPKRRQARNKKLGILEEDTGKDTLVGLLGCSPDEADSFVIAVHLMVDKGSQAVVTGF
jgi:hypothetical protein